MLGKKHWPHKTGLQAQKTALPTSLLTLESGVPYRHIELAIGTSHFCRRAQWLALPYKRLSLSFCIFSLICSGVITGHRLSAKASLKLRQRSSIFTAIQKLQPTYLLLSFRLLHKYESEYQHEF